MGLELSEKKTEVMTYKIHEHGLVRAVSEAGLKKVKDFKYLGSWVEFTEQDMKIREALLWKALNAMSSNWKS